MLRNVWRLTAGAVMVGAAAWAAEPLPSGMDVNPTDPKVYYTGRFDLRDAKGPRCQWSQSMVTLRFRGTALQAKIADSKDNFYEVEIDGKDGGVIRTVKGDNVVDLAKDLPAGEHTVRLARRTEAFVGTTQFQGFILNADGELLEPARMARKIEVIGDSISCGYGNEGKNEKEHFSPQTENAYLSYGAITARAVGAEYVCTAWSGRKMWPDNTLPSIYGLTLPMDASSQWDFAKWKPDVVLINLATNDFRNGVAPDEAGWTAAYVAFVQRVRKNYPDAMIYLASGSMMSDWPADKKPLTVLKGYLARIEKELTAQGDKRIRVLHFAPQNRERDGLGGDWHPSLATHRRMADVFIAALQADLGWKPVAAAQP